MSRARYDFNRSSALNVRRFGAAGTGMVDDRPAIQAALDEAARLGGGTVYLPAGTYRIGTPHSTYGSPPVDNQPLIVHSHTHLVGVNPGRTILRLADDVRQNPGYSALFGDTLRGATMIVNAANPWWWGRHWGVNVPLPDPDEDVVIANMSLDGNRQGQTTLYVRGNRTEGRISDPLPNLSAWQPPTAGGAGPTTHVLLLAITYVDAFGNETGSLGSTGPINIDAAGGPMVVDLPIRPAGAQHFYLYIAYKSPTGLVDLDSGGNHRYMRFGPYTQATETGARHVFDLALLRPGLPTFQLPGTILAPAGSGASNGLFFGCIAGVLLCNLEIENFVLDALTFQGVDRPGGGMAGVEDFHVEHVDMRNNGRVALCLDGPARRVHFHDCRFDDSDASACDIAEQTEVGIEDLSFSECRFRNNKVTIQPKEGKFVRRVSFVGCLFDGPRYASAGLQVYADGTAYGVRVEGCTFRGIRRHALDIAGVASGVVEGCNFDGNGTTVVPGFFDAQIRLAAPDLGRSSWSILTNRIRPPAGCNVVAIEYPNAHSLSVSVTHNFFEATADAPEANLLSEGVRAPGFPL